MDKIGIKNFYCGEVKTIQDCSIKDECEDFIVQEVCEGDHVCKYEPILNVEKYEEAKNLVENLPKGLNKEERKEIYSKLHYYPFKVVKTENGEIVLKDSLVDIFNFTVMKFDLNTSDMIGIISKRLNVPFKSIQVSGNKDKKAVTFQEVSAEVSFEDLFKYAVNLNSMNFGKSEIFGYSNEIEELNKKAIERINSDFQIFSEKILDQKILDEKIKIFNIRKGYHKKLGSHSGNLFTIKLNGLKEIKSTPTRFINYFGPQRFGKHMNNHIIGKFILEKNYQEAIDLILNDTFLDSTGKAIEGESSPESKIQKFIKKMIEKKLKPKQIIEQMNRECLMLYLHSYQSYIFNNEISEKFDSGKFLETDKIKVDNNFIDLSIETKIEDVYAQLKKLPSKFLKGSQRKVIEEIKDFSYWKDQTGNIVVRFKLNSSAYATMALREMVGDAVFKFD